MNYQVRPISNGDLPKIANIHKEAFPDHLLGMLSRQLIQDFYTPYIYHTPDHFLCIETEGQIIGFILGGDAAQLNQAKREFLHKHYLKFGCQILCRPKALLLFVKQHLSRGNQTLKKENAYIGTVPLRLLSIAIRPQFQGSGAARTLTTAFEEQLATCYANEKPLRYGLGVHQNNLKAIRFYEKTGFLKNYSRGDSLYLYKPLT